MSRRDRQRLDDIEAALEYDAVRVRLIEIGEAVKGLSADLLAAEPDLPWAQIAGMRDRLAHRYFDASHAIVQGTVDNDLPVLAATVERLRSHLTD